MTLKKSVFGAIAALALAASVAAPVATAQVGGSTAGTSVVVNVASPGVFNLTICGEPAQVNLTTTSQPQAGLQGEAEGTLTLCYTDTKSYRPNFNVTMQSTDFLDGTKVIPASGFTVEDTANVGQIQWSSGVGRPLGDIGHFQNNIYPTAGQGTTTAWTSDNSLDVARTVHFGYNGEGTIASAGDIDVALEMPFGAQDGTYSSTLTVTVVTPGTQFK